MKSNARQNPKAVSLYRQQPLFPLSTEAEHSSHTSSWGCQVFAVGKRRDGGTRYWCLRHKADATAKYGKPAIACRAAHIPPIEAKDRLELNVDDYRGGIALWGAVPPVYDTTALPMDRGIHVHARAVIGGMKKIDRTFRAVQITGDRLPNEGIHVSEFDAIYFMVTSVFGYEMKYITCSYCDYPHLDRDWFSVHPHRRHLCAGCGRHFLDTEIAIGNPISRLRNICGIKMQTPNLSQKSSAFDRQTMQEGFRFGVRIRPSSGPVNCQKRKASMFMRFVKVDNDLNWMIRIPKSPLIVSI